MEIKPYPKNAKKHPKKQIEQVANSIKEFGMNQPIVVDKDGVIIVGHGRYEALKHLGWEIKDEYIKVIDIPKSKANAYRLADNKLNESDWDMELVMEELKELTPEEIDLTGFEKDLIIEPDEKDDEVPEIPDEPRSKLGDLYELGEHRVLCGDCLDTSLTDKLFGGKKANMTFTDPPYLMGFTGNVHGDGTKSHNSKFGAIKNDKMSEEDGRKFIGDFIRTLSAYVNGAYYICFYRLGLHYIFNGLHENDMEYKAVIIWDKGNHTLSNSDYMSKYEPIVYGWNGDHKFYGGRSSFDIWNIDRTSKNELHPTMKPIALCEKAILNSSEQNGIVMDLFLGSGSTLIASEKTGRICYGMELDPKYVDVIVQRYVDYVENPVVKLNGKEISWEKTKK